MPISEIFARFGEPHFRDGARRVIGRLMDHGHRIIATGGGAVLDAGNRDAMSVAGHVIYLQVELAEQLRRLAGDTGRPLLDVADRAQRLAELQALREPLYREVADLVFETSSLPPDAVAEALAALPADDEETHA